MNATDTPHRPRRHGVRPHRGRVRTGSMAAALTVALVAGALAAVPASARKPDEPRPFRLSPGEPRFWDGEHVQRVYRSAFYSRTVDRALRPYDLCQLEGPCFEYTLLLPDIEALSDHELRVGVDWGIAPHTDTTGVPVVQRDPHTESNGQSVVEIYAPDGTRVVYSDPWWEQQDLRIPGSLLTAGAWRVRVIPVDAEDASFRMRALLDEPAPAVTDGVLLPNLRAIPPFDFKFKLPGGTMCSEPGIGVGTQTGCVNPPDGLDYPVTCTADEFAGEFADAFEPVRCLRIALGFENAGRGPLDIRYSPADLANDPDTGSLSVPAFQLVYSTNGGNTTTEERRAGTVEWHATHGHYHVADMVNADWFRVVRKNTLAAQPLFGRKISMCLASEKLADWHLFYQARLGASGTSCSRPDTGDGRYIQWLSTGWGDVYEWDRPHNYVPVTEDGEYVLRLTANPAGNIWETDNSDNVSYAHVRIASSHVELLERGYGTDPWDDNKLVMGTW